MTENVSPGRKKARVGWWVFIGLVLLVPLLVFLAAPSILSTGGVRRAVLGVATPRGMELDVRNWRFSWFGPSRVEGVRFVSSNALSSVRVGSAELRKGLLSVWSDKGDFGEIRIDRFEVDVMLPRALATEPAGGVQGPGPTAAKLPDGMSGALPPGTPDTAEEAVPEDAVADTVPVPLRLSVPVRGIVRLLDGAIRVRPEESTDAFVLEHVSAAVELGGTGALVRAVLEAQQGRVPGTLRGELVLADGGTTPVADIRGRLQVDGWDLSGMVPLLTAAGTGMSCGGVLDGSLACTMRAGRALERLGVDGRFSVRDLKLSGTPLSGDTPSFDAIELVARLDADPAGVKIHELFVKAPFLVADASGTVVGDGAGGFPAFDLQAGASLDIAVLARELPRTLGLQPDLTFEQGTVVARGSASNTTAGAVCAFRLNTGAIRAVRGGVPVAWDAPIHADADLLLAETGPVVRKLEMTSPFARAEVSGDTNRLGLQADADLAVAYAEISKLVAMSVPAPSGRMRIEAAIVNPLGMERSLSANAQVDGLRIVTPDGEIRQEKATASTQVKAVFGAAGQLERVDNFRATFAGDHFRIEAAATGIRQEPPATLPDVASFVVGGSAAVEPLLAALRRAGFATNAPAMAGAASIEAVGAVQGGVVAVRSSRATVTNLMVMGTAGIAYRDPCLATDVRGQVDLNAGAVRMDHVTVRALPGVLAASGTLHRVEEALALDLAGETELDYANVAKLVDVFAPGQVIMSGQSRRPFRIAGNISGATPVKQLAGLRGDFGLLVPRVQAYGLHLEDVNVELPLRDGRAEPVIRAGLNGGELELRPVVELAGARPRVTLPPASRVLRGVQVNRDVARAVLAKVHPVFWGCQNFAGKLDVELDRLDLPLDSARAKELDIAGRITVTNLSMEAEGVLAGALSLAKVEDLRTVVDSREIRFHTEKGRIIASPLAVGGGAERFTFSGSVGLDGTLDYGVDVPVTRALVGERAYGFLQGTTLRVAIGGTVEKPVLGSESFMKSVQDLAGKALQNLMLKEGGQLLQQILRP